MRAVCLLLLPFTVFAATPRVRADVAEVSEQAEPSTPEPPAPTLVTGLDEIVPLVSADPELAARAHDLDRRVRRANLVGGLSILGGVALMVLGVMSLQEAPETCSGFCVAKTSPVTWPAIGTGFGLAVTGGLVGYWLMPPRRALRGLIDPWNRRNPDKPIAMLELPCGDGDRQCGDRPFPLPPELVSHAVVFNMRGRHGFGARLQWGEFVTAELDRGLRHNKLIAHRSRYRKTLEHPFSFSFRGHSGDAKIRCREHAREEGAVGWGRETSVTIGPFKLEKNSTTTFTPATSTHGFRCDVQAMGQEEWRIEAVEGEDPGFVLFAGARELLRARPYRASAQNAYWWETTNGYRIDLDGQAVAIVDLEESGRVALSHRLATSDRLRVAVLTGALVLEADSFRARSFDESTMTPFW
jgi:hypothetical protein